MFMARMGLNDHQVSVDCNLSVGLLTKTRQSPMRDLGRKSIDKILNKYPEVNKVWLLRGEGEMLVKPGASEATSGEISSESVKLSENYDKVFLEVVAAFKEQLTVKDKQIERLLDLLNAAK